MLKEKSEKALADMIRLQLEQLVESLLPPLAQIDPDNRVERCATRLIVAPREFRFDFLEIRRETTLTKVV